jgi:quercetin dioxygenase-like cupin family protein
MKAWRRWRQFAGTLLCAALAGGSGDAVLASSNSPQNQNGGRTRLTLSHVLPRLDGEHLKVSAVEVIYAPGGSSLPHTHPCPVVGYVVEGAVRMQVKGGAEAVYKAGDSFYEDPNGIHLVSANASDKQPAKFIAYFVCDHDVPLSSPVPKDQVAGDKR